MFVEEGGNNATSYDVYTHTVRTFIFVQYKSMAVMTDVTMRELLLNRSIFNESRVHQNESVMAQLGGEYVSNHCRET